MSRYLAVTGCAGDVFLSYVNKDGPDGCWLWRGGVMSMGYGMFSASRLGIVCKLAHRWSYEYHVGPIPQGLVLDHLCDNRLCVNPAHLNPTTHQKNILRGNGVSAREARQTHCIHGHPFSGDNLILVKRKRGVDRRCRTCTNEMKRRHWHRDRSAA